jgi:hypothetical protein
MFKAEATASNPVRTGRLKGKARKEAKKADASGPVSSSARSAGTLKYTITTQEFTTMAEWIANQKSPIKIPQVIITLLHSAIALRKRCSEWFQSKAGHEAVKNISHSHFIQVLEKVQQI